MLHTSVGLVSVEGTSMPARFRPVYGTEDTWKFFENETVCCNSRHAYNHRSEGLKVKQGTPCSHCHEINFKDSRTWPYCHLCGHRCDVPRWECDCDRCTHMKANRTRDRKSTRLNSSHT